MYISNRSKVIMGVTGATITGVIISLFVDRKDQKEAEEALEGIRDFAASVQDQDSDEEAIDCTLETSPSLLSKRTKIMIGGVIAGSAATAISVFNDQKTEAEPIAAEISLTYDSDGTTAEAISGVVDVVSNIITTALTEAQKQA